jgi:hypothetical protein
VETASEPHRSSTSAMKSRRSASCLESWMEALDFAWL